MLRTPALQGESSKIQEQSSVVHVGELRQTISTGMIVRSTLYLRALRINFSVRTFVRAFVLRKIITFCEGDMDPVTHHMSTGSLKLDILGSRK